MKYLFTLLIIVSGIIGFGIGQEMYEPKVISVPSIQFVDRDVIVRVLVPKIIEKPVPIHNEPGLHEFESRRELEKYIGWYRNNAMREYGAEDCEDYAYDFMLQAIADGYLVSTEIVQEKNLDGDEVWHMANTVPVGNEVYLVDICPGKLERYALKD